MDNKEIEKMLNHYYWRIRMVASFQPNISTKNINKCLGDKEYFIRENALFHLKFNHKNVDHILKQHYEELPHRIIHKIINSGAK